MINNNKLTVLFFCVRRFFLGSTKYRLSILFGLALAASLSLSGGILFPNPLFTFDSSGILSTYGRST